MYLVGLVESEMCLYKIAIKKLLLNFNFVVENVIWLPRLLRLLCNSNCFQGCLVRHIEKKDS